MELPGWNHHLSLIKHWSLSATLIAHCQMLYIAIVVVVEALGLSLLHIYSTAKSFEEL